MPSRTRWLTLAALAAAVALPAGPPDAALRAQQPKAGAKAAPKPSRRAAAPHVYKVQARNPHWHTSGVTTRPAALAAARRLRSQGWTARVKARAGKAVVRYRMTRWHTRAVVTGKARANAVAGALRARQFQARVLTVK
jgi:hypothetical protein